MKPRINIDNIEDMQELVDTINKTLNENQLFTEANQFQNEIFKALDFQDAISISRQFVDFEKPDIFSIPRIMERGYIVSHDNSEIIEPIIQKHKVRIEINKKKKDASQNPGVDGADFPIK